jgi:hypothetical protein
MIPESLLLQYGTGTNTLNCTYPDYWHLNLFYMTLKFSHHPLLLFFTLNHVHSNLLNINGNTKDKIIPVLVQLSVTP